MSHLTSRIANIDELLGNPQKKRDISQALQTIFQKRHIIDEHSRTVFFNPTLIDLNNPFLFKTMSRIVNRLRQAQEKNETVLISSDRDVDGLTSSAILMKAFEVLGWKRPQVFFPALEMGNGLNDKMIDNFSKEGGKVIITCDCGIRNIDEAKKCRDLGVDLIITDHHIAAEIPEAFAILNPKLPNEPEPFKELAACGVAFKLACAIILSERKEFDQTIAIIKLGANNKLSGQFIKNGIRIFENPVYDNMPEFQECLRESLYCFSVHPEEKPQIIALLKNRGIIKSFLDFQSFYCKVFRLKNFPPPKTIIRCLHLHEFNHQHKSPLLNIFAESFCTIWTHRHRSVRTFCEDIMDILAIGTIGDLVPLIGENRTFIKLGLKALEKGTNPGLKALAQHTKLYGRHITNKDVATQIIPYLNSPGRLGQSTKSLDLLLFKAGDDIRQLMDEITYYNSKRKEMTYKTYRVCKDILLKTPSILKNPLIILCRYNSVPGVSGIVSAKLAKEFKKPAIIITVSDGMGTASCRTSNDFNIYSALIHCDRLLTAYGGHPYAAGFTIEERHLPEFSQRINEFSKNAPELTVEEHRKVVIDSEINLENIDNHFLRALSQLKPFGIGNPIPIFYSRNLRILNFSKVGNESSNILFELHCRNYPKLEGLCLNKAYLLDSLPRSLKKIDILYTIEVESPNFTIPKLRIIDFSLSGSEV